MRSESEIHGTSLTCTVRKITWSCSTLLCSRLCMKARGAPSCSPRRNTAAPGTRGGGEAISESITICSHGILLQAQPYQAAAVGPGQHDEEDDGGDGQREPASLHDPQRVGAEEGG